MSGRTSDDIRREIERKRGEMDRTVDALERKLSPGQLLDHALWMVRGSDTGSQKARAAGDAVAGFARDHPIPVALMSAGAAWLAAESRRGSDTGPGTYGRAEGRVGPYMGDALDEGSLRGDGRFASDGHEEGVTDRAREKAGELKDRVSGATAEASDRLESVRDRVESAGDLAREGMHAASDSARAKVRAAGDRSAEMARRAREQTSLRAGQARARYSSTLEENPLAIGAAAFGLGVAAGLSAPSSRVEKQRMGPAADALKDEARTMGQDAVRAARHAGGEALSVARREAMPEGGVEALKGRVKHVASEAMNAAKETAREEGLGAEQLRDRAKRVASDAASAARNTAREEGLSPEALKERAREAGEHTREAAREGMS